MIRFLPIGLVVIAILGGLLYWRFTAADKKLVDTLPEAQISGEGLLQDRVGQLEVAVVDLIKQGRDLKSGGSSSATWSSEIKALQTSVTDLQTQVKALKNSQTTTSTAATNASSQVSTSKAPVYIPLGWTGSSKATDWTTISGQEIAFDPAEYVGYTSIQFEINMRIFQNGKAFARLLNKDDGTAVLSSEVSTTATDYTWLVSSGFQLPGSKKTYRLQVKSLTGYSTDVQNARLKVFF